MKLKQYYSNSIQVRVVCADLERYVDGLLAHGISISDIQYLDEITANMVIPSKFYDRIKNISYKYNADVRMQNNSLLSKSIDLFRARPLLILGGIVFLVLSVIISRTILFVNVVGNDSVNEARIIEQAEACGLHFGANRSKVNSERIKNVILQKIPELQWAGVNTSGCVATVYVKERSDLQNESSFNGPVSIVAAKDGIINSVTLIKGTSTCKNGQAVNKGDVLISPYVDYGNITVLSGAEGEVYADTVNEIRLLTFTDSIKRTDNSESKLRISFIFRKKLINLYNCSGILDGSCVKMYSERTIRLPGGLELPITLCLEEYTNCKTSVTDLDQSNWPIDAAKTYLTNKMISGKIIDYQTSVSIVDRIHVYDLIFTCREMIGMTQKEEIFIFNGKDN